MAFEIFQDWFVDSMDDQRLGLFLFFSLPNWNINLLGRESVYVSVDMSCA